MLNLETVQADIEQWIVDFVEVPHPALGGWSPCPYARRARLDRDFEVRLGLAPIHDLIKISKTGIEGKGVIAIAYDPGHYTHEEFSSALDIANREFLLPNDLLALEDHPDDPEIVNVKISLKGSVPTSVIVLLVEPLTIVIVSPVTEG